MSQGSVDEMYAVDLKRVGDKHALAAPKREVSVLDAWHARLAHADGRARKWREIKDVVRDKDIRLRSELDCYFRVQGNNVEHLHDVKGS